MRNYVYSLVAVTALSIVLFSSAGTRPALAASDVHNQIAWGETADVLSDSPDNVLIDAAADAEANAEADAAVDVAANNMSKTMKSGSGGGKPTAVAM